MPNWEDYFTPLNREEQFSLKLTDILRINKQESEIEVWTDGVMIFERILRKKYNYPSFSFNLPLLF